MEQEFVVGGYIHGSRGFDALLVGVYLDLCQFVARKRSFAIRSEAPRVSALRSQTRA